MKRNIMVKVRELELGDIVKLSDSCYMTATITQIKDGLITFFRPFVHHDAIETAGGIMCYTGIETFQVYQDSEVMYFCYQHDNEIK